MIAKSSLLVSPKAEDAYSSEKNAKIMAEIRWIQNFYQVVSADTPVNEANHELTRHEAIASVKYKQFKKAEHMVGKCRM